jgi:lantibiotic modifying enzyme
VSHVVGRVASPGPQVFLDAAEALGQQIVAATARARDGSIYWRGPADVNGEVVPAPLGAPLYPGTLGVALFLAALERVLGGGHYGALCQAGILPLRHEIARLAADPDRADQIQHGIGGLSGLGSIVYALVRIGDLLDQPALYRDAHAVASLITPERIARDDSLDIMLGSAGAALALLALDQRVPEACASGHTPLALATACARHLLDRQRPHQGRFRAWDPGTGAPLGGFCHGAAGIAHALLRLHARTRDPALARAARDGIEYERSLFDHQRADWSYLPGPAPRFANRWCKGAPGILIGRSGALTVHDDLAVRADIDAAIARTTATRLNDVDNVCCGNLGRVEALLYAAPRLASPALQTAAQELATRVLVRAGARAGLSMPARFERVFDPRFFTGLSGAGYALLRLVTPDALPCVLAMD